MKILELEQALDFVDEQLRAHRKGKGLTELEIVILEGIWNGLYFQAISSNYPHATTDHIQRNAAPQLYRRLRTITGEKVNRGNLKKVISQAYQRKQKAPNPEAIAQAIRSKIQGSVQENCGTMRVLDMLHPIGLDNIYTEVNILTKVASKCWQDLTEFQPRQRRDFNRLGYGKIARERVSGLEAVAQHSKLLILGKPGAGKTTFSKRLAIQCINGSFQADLVPIFIALREFAVSKGRPDLRAYIDQKMEIEGIQSTEIEVLLHHGKAFLLLDGLDEVKAQESSRVIEKIRDFAQNFYHNRFVITCRIAAHDYVFDKFTEVEIADFSQSQINDFVKKWFGCRLPDNAQELIDKFHEKLESNASSKELVTNPLLLTFLCLVFEEYKNFPRKRSQLYKEGLDLLLQKWDSKRNIERPELYQNLDRQQKEDLLIYLAYQTFSQDRYFFSQDEVEQNIVEYIRNLPKVTTDPRELRLDSQALLKGIEAQHGLLVERARGIYSFSHLTFQEYFTACRIVKSSNPEEQESLFHRLVKQVANKQWREVFLFTVEKLSNSDYLLKLMKEKVDDIVSINQNIQNALKWLQEKTDSIDHSYKPACVRASYFEAFLDDGLPHFLTTNKNLPYDLSIDESLKGDLGLAIGSNPKTENKMSGLDYSLDRTIDSQFDRDLEFEFRRGQVEDRKEIHEYAKTRDRASILKNSLEIVGDPNLRQELQNLKAQISGHSQETEQWWTEQGKTWTEELRSVMIQYRNIGHDWQFTDEQYELLKHYYNANLLLVDCLNTCHYVSRDVRQEIEETLLLPIDELKKRPKKPGF